MPVFRRAATGLPYLVMAGLLWGTGGLTGTLLGRFAGLSPLAVAGYRLAAGGLLIVVVTRRPLPRGRAAWTRIAIVGLLAACFQSCYFLSLSLTSVALATLVTIGSAPLLVLAAECVMARRRVTRAEAGVTGLALAGLALLVGLPSGGFRETSVLASAGLALLAGCGFAAITVIGKRPVPGLDDRTLTGFAFCAGGLVLLPLAAAVTAGIGFRPGPAALGLLLALATAPTAVAYTLYFRGLRAAPASIAALLSLLEPLTGTVLAALILGQRLGPTGIAGAFVLASAVVLAGHIGGTASLSPRDSR
jgi:drug/metabolite transporter, DME family